MRPSHTVRTVWDAEAIDTSQLGFRPIQKIATIHARQDSSGEFCITCLQEVSPANLRRKYARTARKSSTAPSARHSG